MTVELVRTRTDDNVRLEGALFRPTAGSRGPRAWPADLVILVHGTGNNFYSPGILEHAAATVAAAGTPALRINTRGHDGLSGGRGGRPRSDHRHFPAAILSPNVPTASGGRTVS